MDNVNSPLSVYKANKTTLINLKNVNENIIERLLMKQRGRMRFITVIHCFVPLAHDASTPLYMCVDSIENHHQVSYQLQFFISFDHITIAI